ncbi:hypothetical protein AALO_G00121820 [Alosa alosa]|uniref:Maturase K n=1 Tax=Alosa alosa TaxID=278164 RepID=A0AAV6GK58_9TELE|nr:hypothetical protein AALO_G00121820 [Alosa alosa]
MEANGSGVTGTLFHPLNYRYSSMTSYIHKILVYLKLNFEYERKVILSSLQQIGTPIGFFERPDQIWIPDGEPSPVRLRTIVEAVWPTVRFVSEKPKICSFVHRTPDKIFHTVDSTQ